MFSVSGSLLFVGNTFYWSIYLYSITGKYIFILYCLFASFDFDRFSFRFLFWHLFSLDPSLPSAWPYYHLKKLKSVCQRNNQLIESRQFLWGISVSMIWTHLIEDKQKGVSKCKSCSFHWAKCIPAICWIVEYVQGW